MVFWPQRIEEVGRGGRFAMKFLSLIMVIPVVVAAQSAPARKDIPSIANAANGSIVSIVMSDKDGKPIGQGSGFFVSKDGLIVTNYHVIAEGSSAVVKFPDGAFYVVDGVLASDKARDVAVIKAHGQNFKTLPLGNSDRVQVGEEVVAIGNPLSLESTVSNGIVSGIRAVKEEGGKFLQITAPISPGSSGGPLFNMAGEVVGITTMYLKGGENLNFAIPINDAKRLLTTSKEPSTVVHPIPGLESATTEPKGDPTFSKIKIPPRYHIISFEPNTRIVMVRQGNKLFTAKVVDAYVCKFDKAQTMEEFDSEKPCKQSSSIAGDLVGQDIASIKEVIVMHETFDGYYLTGSPFNGLAESRRNSPVFEAHSEVWRIEKIEEVQ